MRRQSVFICLCAGLIWAGLASFTFPPFANARAGKRSTKANARAVQPKRPPPAPAPIIEDAAEEDVVAQPQPTPAATQTQQQPDPSTASDEAPAAEGQGNASGPEALRARYEELRDQVFRSRARRETLEKALISTKVGFEVRWEANRKFRLDKAEIRLDGTAIWDAHERPVTEDPITLAERSAAPGAHGVTLRFEVRSRDKVEMGYVSEQTFTISLPEGKVSRVRISVDEDGSLPSYNPEIQIKVETL